jgi:kinesin family protein 3/17
MEGKASPPELRGIIPKTFDHIFKHIGANTDPTKQFFVRCSYLEIYNEEIRDLLSKTPEARLELKEDADHHVYVKDLTATVVKSSAEMEMVLGAGGRNRVTGATLMNATSSRSHAVFSITMETAEPGEDGKQHFKVGKMNLVDLAGSERQSKTGATGQRLKEATKINQSLMALGNVISALVDGKSTHVPYRDSKLTRLLQDSLGGNTKTVMIANCGPADYNHDETLSTLRYADRAKQIRNKPRVNEDPKDAMLRKFQEEILQLKAALAERAAAEAAGGSAPRTMMIGGKEVAVPSATVVERVVERVVGASEEEMKALRDKAAAEREELVARAEKERRELLLAAASDAEERKRIEGELAARHAEAERERAEKKALEEKLLAMQSKLLVGGEVLDKAARQEEELKRAQLELEERRLQEAKMARELEEANVMIEEQYGTMAEEVSASACACAVYVAGGRAMQQTTPLLSFSLSLSLSH